MNAILLLAALCSADPLPPLPDLPPPRLSGTISLGWGLGASRLETDAGEGWGMGMRAFGEWHPWEAFSLRTSVKALEARGKSESFRTSLMGTGLDGFLEWPSGPFRPRLGTGIGVDLVNAQYQPGTTRFRPRERWTFRTPVELGAEWILGPQVSLQLWGEAQVYSSPGDLLDGLAGGGGSLGARDQVVTAGISAAYRLDPVRDTDHDGVDDSRDRCRTASEDRDGFQDEDGCPDPDNDKDGLSDGKDECPDLAEDRDGFQDSDGCPDPDNDLDGVPDAADRCPLSAEDRDGFQDSDGCPDPDNDQDGVLDAADRCPLSAEDRDGFQDSDGCPEFDNDGDAVPDSLDQCPREAEDRDGFQDGDGCPDLDNDRDGIVDSADKCPNIAETVNGFQDVDGCPDIALAPGASMIADRVWFHESSDEFLQESEAMIQEIGDWLAKSSEVSIEIRGYTDDLGSDRVNQILSQKRAEALRQALLSRGISPARVRSKGFGKSNPIASNRTQDGRARNRRLEIVRIH
ncbi:MAG: OmpA family protein [Fibrobacteria bacterium]|nr:OmpA family protein [Fibrobacteria bacterium]